jgi:tripartite-type tricarboxylate transporter receptor subunit TctC
MNVPQDPQRRAALLATAAAAATSFGLTLGAAPAVAQSSSPSSPPPAAPATAAASTATDWPTRPVRIITPFPAGGGPETVARMVADKLQKKWGKPVIVENKPGANGFLAIDAFKRGAQDGHDLIQLDNVHLVVYQHLFKKLPYDPVKDFEPITPLFRTYFFVGVPTNSKYKTVGDLVADARARPAALNYGSWSVGNPVHLGSAQLEALTHTQMQHVIYKETSMLYTAVANGELQFALGSMATAGPLQRAGRIRFIAVTAPRRHPAFPDLPTVAESGGPAGYEATGWTTIAAPKNLPKAVADKIQRDIEAALAEPDIKERYATFGYDLFPVTREQFGNFMVTESAKYADIVKRFNIALD